MSPRIDNTGRNRHHDSAKKVTKLGVQMMRDRSTGIAMRCLMGAIALASPLLASPAWTAPDESIRVELNATESVQARCRLTFLIENKGAATIESLKLDLAI